MSYKQALKNSYRVDNESPPPYPGTSISVISV